MGAVLAGGVQVAVGPEWCRGPMADVMHSLEILATWIETNRYRPVGYHREVYLDYDPAEAEQGVTELQVAVVKG